MRAFRKEGAGGARFSKGFSKKTFFSVGVRREYVGNPRVRIEFNRLPQPEHSFVGPTGVKEELAFLGVNEPRKGIKFPGARSLFMRLRPYRYGVALEAADAAEA